MPNVELDIRRMIKASKFGPPHDVVLQNGKKIQGIPGFVDIDDPMVGEMGISGHTRTLRCEATEVDQLIPTRSFLFWNNQKWTIINTKHIGNGAGVLVYLSVFE
jgi:hypothetical protein